MSNTIFTLVLNLATHLFSSFFHKASKKLTTYGFFFSLHNKTTRTNHNNNLIQNIAKFPPQKRDAMQTLTLISDFHGSLLKPTSSHLFPYFMLVACEGGSPMRALLLLLSSPILWVFGYESKISIKMMTFITFCMLRVKDMELVNRAVLPKFYMENLNGRACEVLGLAGRRVVVSGGLPRVMVEGFVREYLEVEEVVGCEMHVVRGGRYFSGLICGPGLTALKELFGEVKADVGLVGSSNPHDHLFISYCKESYLVTTATTTTTITTNSTTNALQSKFPKKTLIFHDSRLSILPTPLTSLSLLLFLPLSIPLSISRILLGILPPYPLIFPLAALTGTRFRAQLNNQNSNKNYSSNTCGGSLYVCTHRTLLDPVMLATALQRPVPAVTYSLSPFSEALAPMKTVRLTRNRQSDSKIILNLLNQGDLTICPEGTTCREPYLLRFSPLFAELSDSIVPIAMEAQGSWFYGTTASGLKWLDPLFFFMDPYPGYRVRVLDRIPVEMTVGGGGKSGSEVANWVQHRLGEALGFECTGLTRRDKYMMLAENEGIVKKKKQANEQKS